MRHLQQTRSSCLRSASLPSRWQRMAHAALVTAAFLFVGGVTLGVFP